MSAEVAEVAEESEQKPRLGSVHELWCTYTKDAGREVWGSWLKPQRFHQLFDAVMRVYWFYGMLFYMDST